MKTAVAVSGGADSLYALSVLKAAGHDLLALHGIFIAPRENLLPKLHELCARLGVPLHVADLRKEFRQRVIDPFTAAWSAGQTPNPCAHCNRDIKFGFLLDMARELGASRLATGHYAAFSGHPVYGAALRQAADANRDQSYFLSLVPGEALERAVFPLAGIRKREMLDALACRGLEAPLPEESREICFVHGDYRDFLAANDEQLPGAGAVCLRDGRVIGRHGGLWRHTEGQRRGLGLSWSEPLYALEKDCAANRLIVGTAREALSDECRAFCRNVFAPPAQWPRRLFVRARYRQEASAAEVSLAGDELRIHFHAPQMLCAPGQIACVYDHEGWVLAAGIIHN